MEFEVGDIVVGKYEIKKLLGAGGMGKVYRARQVDLGRDVALKIPSQQVIESPEVMARFIREAKTVARLTHDNVVQVYEYHHEGELAFIAMEFVEGKDLKQFVNTPPDDIKVSDVAAILGAACEGLGHAHEFGIVHRDIKPHNIMVARLPRGKWRVKVMDFGIAHVDQSSPFTQMDENQLTQTGQALGTPSYMAPEQIRGAGVSHLSDLYSFGCVVYYVFTRQTVFTGSGLTVAVAHLNEMPPSIRTQIPGIPEAFDRVILRCLEKDPSKRYQVANDLGDAIREALAPIADTPMSDIWRQSLQASDATIPIAHAPTTPSAGSELIEVQTKGTINRSSLMDATQNSNSSVTMTKGTVNATPSPMSTPRAAASTLAEPTIAGKPLLDAPAPPKAERKTSLFAILAGVAAVCLVAGIGAALFAGGGKKDGGPSATPTPAPTMAGAEPTAAPSGTPEPVGTEVAVVRPTPPIEARPTPEPTPSPSPTQSPDEMAKMRAKGALDASNRETSMIPMARAWRGIVDEARKVRDNDPVRTDILKMADQVAERLVKYPKMIDIEAGSFTMGQDDSAEGDSVPSHRVQLPSYAIGQYEVSAIEFATFLNLVGDTMAGKLYAPKAGWNIAYDDELKRYVPLPDRELHPANGVSWTAAKAYAEWLAGNTGKLYRLPTEAEWERAARGTGQWRYPYGNELPSTTNANFGRPATVPINELSPAGLGAGLFHVGGNVAEWCADWHDPKYYATAPSEDPRGPSDSVAEDNRLRRKVLRGGSFRSGAEELSLTLRGRAEPDDEEADIGFRLALTP